MNKNSYCRNTYLLRDNKVIKFPSNQEGRSRDQKDKKEEDGVGKGQTVNSYTPVWTHLLLSEFLEIGNVALHLHIHKHKSCECYKSALIVRFLGTAAAVCDWVFVSDEKVFMGWMFLNRKWQWSTSCSDGNLICFMSCPGCYHMQTHTNRIPNIWKNKHTQQRPPPNLFQCVHYSHLCRTSNFLSSGKFSFFS